MNNSNLLMTLGDLLKKHNHNMHEQFQQLHEHFYHMETSILNRIDYVDKKINLRLDYIEEQISKNKKDQ